VSNFKQGLNFSENEVLTCQLSRASFTFDHICSRTCIARIHKNVTGQLASDKFHILVKASFPSHARIHKSI